ncbi:MAG: tetratricopeptide repeat protein [Candidatus Gastranaerophilales bacterium]|nr:tetratricopeptide repeat protein [Candidatus Gastranaerophilales bacterium]
MKKLFILSILCTMLFLSGCVKNLSNIDIQKLNQKATEYMEQGEYDKAIARLESSLDLNGDFPATYYNLGVAYYQTNNYEEAAKALNQAIEKQSDMADAYYSRAVVYEDWAYSILEGEDTDNAKDKKQPTNEDKATSLKYLENAKKDFEKYLELKPNAQDKSDVEEKIVQIDNDLNNGEQKEN